MIPSPEGHDGPEARAGSDSRDLTSRASLTAAAGIFRHASRLLVAIAFAPFVIRGLGADAYGLLLLFQQASGYVVLADLRAGGTLKFTLATRQHVADVTEKRRQVGAALAIWAATLPLLLAFAVGVTMAFPHFVSSSVAPSTMRAGLALVFLSAGLDRVLSIPAHALRGMNLDYRSTWADAFVIAASGALAVAAALGGLGLVGVAAAGLAGTLAAGIVRTIVAVRALPWFGVDRPTRSDLDRFTKLSGWLIVGDFAAILLFASDLLILGFALGPVEAAIYSATGAALALSATPILEVLTSGGPGVTRLASEGEWERLRKLRSELETLTAGLLTIVGTAYLALNASFVPLWIGGDFFGGQLLTILLGASIVVGTLLRVESALLDATLDFRSRSLATLAAGSLSACVAVPAVGAFGAPGLLVTMITSRLVLLGWLRRRVDAHLGVTGRDGMSVSRCSAVSLLLLASGAALGSILSLHEWRAIVGAALPITAATAVIWWLAALDPPTRAALGGRLVIASGRSPGVGR